MTLAREVDNIVVRESRKNRSVGQKCFGGEAPPPTPFLHSGNFLRHILYIFSRPPKCAPVCTWFVLENSVTDLLFWRFSVKRYFT